MPVEIDINPRDLTGNQLEQIYRLFCQAFEIEPTQRHLSEMKDEGEYSLLQELRNGRGIDFRPYMGAKFFASDFSDSVQFHGYSQPEDNSWNQKDKRFTELVLEHYKGRPSR